MAAFTNTSCHRKLFPCLFLGLYLLLETSSVLNKTVRPSLGIFADSQAQSLISKERLNWPDEIVFHADIFLFFYFFFFGALKNCNSSVFALTLDSQKQCLVSFLNNVLLRYCCDSYNLPVSLTRAVTI